MTLRGLFVCFIELFLLILAFGTTIREFFIVAICVAGLIAFSLFSLLVAALTVRVDSTINKKAIIRGDKLHYTLILKGVALLPVAAYLSLKTTELEFNLKSRKRHSFVLMPSLKREHAFVFEIPAVHIGLWEIGIKRMRFEDLFGLFSFPLIKLGEREFSPDLTVMPQIHSLIDDSDSLSMGGYGITALKNSEEGDLLGDSRLYKDGDSLKRINWKLSARTKTIYTRRYETPEKPNVVIVVDKGVLGTVLSDKVDIITETAVSLAKHFLSKNYTVDLIAVRSKKSRVVDCYTLKEYNDIYKIQYSLATLAFYKTESELFLTHFKDYELLKTDRLYLITTNPSKQLLSDFVDLNKMGKIAKCFVPQSVLSQESNGNTVADFQGVCADVNSVEKIAETVGGAL